METIGEKYLKPNPRCIQCRGSGEVYDSVPYGDTDVSLAVGCNCLEFTIPLKNVLLEWGCPMCRVTNTDYLYKTARPICEGCDKDFGWEELMPSAILLLLQEVGGFLDGRYDDKTEEQMAQEISEKMWEEK